MGFTHLHVASGFSLRYGASMPENLARHAAEAGLPALALTDRDSVSGVVRHADACVAVGIRPLFGVDLSVARMEPPAAARRRSPARGGAHVDESAARVVLLARDRTGWANICALLTIGQQARADAGGGQPVVPLDAVADHSDGITALLGPASEPVDALARGRADEAARLLAPWREAFGPYLRLEAVHHGRPGTGLGSLRLAARTVGLAADLDVPCILANAVRYATPEQARIADVLDSARLMVPIHPGGIDNGQRGLKTERDMAILADAVARAAGRDHGGAAHLLAATARTANECRLDPDGDLGLGRVHFPEERLVGAAPGTSARLLRERCERAMGDRGYGRRRDMRQRVDEELELISTLGWPTYFLTVAQVVDDARALGIRAQARGSAAGSLVVHLLGISAANPLDHGLIMERFMNLRRKSLPDIDVDVESARRIEVYQAALTRFGGERVACVAMMETYRARQAIRDTGLALGLPPDEVGRLAKSFPHIAARGVRQAMRELPELQGLAAHADRYGRLWDLVEGLDGLGTQMAMHPCGIVLSDDSLLQRTPVTPTPGDNLPMAAYCKDEVERMGLLKLDILGVRMQSAMAYAVSEVARTTGRSIDLGDPAQVPLDDAKTYELIRSGRTLGCFQIESPGQVELGGRLLGKTFEDIVAQISLFRPGPVSADMIRPFIEARHGRRRPHYAHRDLEPVLAPTFGVIIFNEQVAQCFAVLAKCDVALGEEARRALSTDERLPALEAWFRARAAAAGYSKPVVDEVWGSLKAMGAYGFAKSHGVAFGLATVQSAWLKTHHPAAFYAGLLEHDPGMYPKRLILDDARQAGITIRPVDVQCSTAHWRTEQLGDGTWALRVALADVKGITSEEMARITAGQPFTDIPDFHTRARPSQPLAEHLARIGALETIASGAHRREQLLLLDELHRHTRTAAMPAQLTLATEPEPTGLTGLPAMTEDEQLDAELAVLGMDTTAHLMKRHYPLLSELGVTPSRDLGAIPTGETVLVAGAKVAIQTPPTRSKRRTIFCSLDDGTGAPGASKPVDLVFFDDSHDLCANTLFHTWIVVVRGQVQRRGRSISVVGERVWPLTELAAAYRDGGSAAMRAVLAREPRTQAERAEQDQSQAGRGRYFHASQGSAG